MEKFNIKKIYGYHWMIISLIVQFTIFIFFLGLILYLKTFDLSNANNKGGANEVIIILIIYNIYLTTRDVQVAIMYFYHDNS